MAQVTSIDSNVVGLRYHEEASAKTVGTNPVWRPLEPNTFADFGGEIGTTPRNPINPSRQRKKGVTTSLTASGGFNTDVTQTNIQDLLQGFMFASFRTKDELSVATTDTGGATDDFEPASGGDGYVAGDLIFAKDFSDATANGLFTVSGTPTASEVIVAEGLPTLTGEVGIISKVGHSFGAGELDIDATGDYVSIDRVSGAFDFTTLGLIPGEFIFVGGDTTGASGDQFVTAANNGFKRVRSVAADSITLDKSDLDMVTEVAGTLEIKLFIGRALKNEASPTLQVRRTYQLERTLGVPDDASPAESQAEYLVGAVPSELTLNLAPESLVTADLTFVAEDSEVIEGGTEIKSLDTVTYANATAPAIVEADGFNTTSDFSRFSVAAYSADDEAPTQLFTYNEEFTLSINNNVTPNPALSVLGAAVISVGTFEVSGSLTSFFGNLSATLGVRNNTSFTVDFALAKNNAGFVVDMPLITFGDGRPTVEQDAPIKLPLSTDAATGAGEIATMDHTLMMNFFDYLPTLAQ